MFSSQNFDPNITTFIIWTSTFILFCLAVVIFLGSKKKSSRVFSYMTATTAIWTFMLGLHIAFPVSGNVVVLDVLPRVMHLTGVVAVLLILYFCILFPEDQKASCLIPISMVSFVFLTVPVYLFTDLVVGGEVEWIKYDILGGNIWTWELGQCFFVYMFFFFIIPCYGVFLLYRKKRQAKNIIEKKRLNFMIGTFIIGLTPPAFGSIVLPFVFQEYCFNWMGGITHVFWISLVAYSIMKYNQMNVRVVLTEVLVLTGMFVLFMSIFI